MLQLRTFDLNDLFTESMKELMDNREHWDAIQTPRILSYENLLHAESTAFDFDLSHVGFTKTRWARYCHQYIDPKELDTWIEGLKYISKRGENLFRSKDAIRRKREHFHGSCWLGLSYRSQPSTLVLYSRVAEFPTRAILELTMVHKVGKAIQERLELNKPPALSWFISSLFLSCLHMLPWLSINGVLDETYKRNDPVGHFVRHQIDHIAKGNVKYGPTKRMAKRLEQIEAGTLVPVPIKNLSIFI